MYAFTSNSSSVTSTAITCGWKQMRAVFTTAELRKQEQLLRAHCHC
jgi:hypothetical protein